MARSKYMPDYMIQPFIEAGVDVDGIDLQSACADFYLLERMASDNVSGAERMLKDYENMLAGNMLKYLELACVGEARHAGNDRECKCQEYGDYECDSEPCPNDEWEPCGCDQFADHICGDDDFDAETHECYGCEQESICTGEHEEPCWDCSDHWCCYDGCDECDMCYGGSEDWQGVVTNEALFDLIQWGSGSREKVQRQWMSVEDVDRQQVFSELTDLFGKCDWPSGYGGETWASCARLGRDYVSGSISARVFVNMAWSLQHNNGCVFDKAFSIDNLHGVLDFQANDEYNRLAEYASPEVGRMWREERVVYEVYRSFNPITHQPTVVGYKRSDFSPEWLGR